MFDNLSEKFTVVFLGDTKKPAHFLLLKRAEWKSFAPNLYTSFGGKFEEGETPLQCAERELKEETGITNVPLVEFGRLIINHKRVICLFFGVYNPAVLPECTEGTVERVSVEGVFDKDLIPTARVYLQEWNKRNWDVQTPFTIFYERENILDVNAKVISEQIQEGLLE